MPDEVIIPPVRVFRDVMASKAQALKPLEEAAEVFAAWQEWDRYRKMHAVFDAPKAEIAAAKCLSIIDECCDIIVATCNLLAALGVTDLTDAMDDCERRNEVRGRYGE